MCIRSPVAALNPHCMQITAVGDISAAHIGQARPRGLASTPASSNKSSSGLNLRPDVAPVWEPPCFPATAGLADPVLPLPVVGVVAAAGTCMGDLHLGHFTAFPAKSSRTANVDWHFPQPTLIVIRLCFLRIRFRDLVLQATWTQLVQHAYSRLPFSGRTRSKLTANMPSGIIGQHPIKEAGFSIVGSRVWSIAIVSFSLSVPITQPRLEGRAPDTNGQPVAHLLQTFQPKQDSGEQGKPQGQRQATNVHLMRRSNDTGAVYLPPRPAGGLARMQLGPTALGRPRACPPTFAANNQPALILPPGSASFCNRLGKFIKNHHRPSFEEQIIPIQSSLPI